MTVNERIKLQRLKRGESAGMVAQHLGVNPATVFRWEKNGTNVPRRSIQALAAHLKTTPEWLLTGEEPEDHEEAPSKQPFEALPVGKKIPVLGRISAGLPLYAEQQIEGSTYVNYDDDQEYFALRVVGDSMTAARINDGDLLVVRRQDVVENGQIAVVGVGDDEATVKRFHRDGNTVTLTPQSYNPIHQPQVYNLRKTKIRIYGKVVQIQIAVL